MTGFTIVGYEVIGHGFHGAVVQRFGTAAEAAANRGTAEIIVEVERCNACGEVTRYPQGHFMTCGK